MNPYLTSIGPLSIVFKLSGNIVPKRRPRVTAISTYMPEEYVNWKAYAIKSFSEQMRNNPYDYPIKELSIKILIKGNHKKNGDCDNITGSIFDALVQGGVIQNDNLNNIQELCFKFIPTKDPVMIYIVLNPIPKSIKQRLYVDC